MTAFSGCPICGVAEADCFGHSQYWLAYLDDCPPSPGLCMIFPRRHVPDYSALGAAELAELKTFEAEVRARIAAQFSVPKLFKSIVGDGDDLTVFPGPAGPRKLAAQHMWIQLNPQVSSTLTIPADVPDSAQPLRLRAVRFVWCSCALAPGGK